MAFAQFQFRRDTAANWTTADPILAEGEIGLELDTDQFKIGDGTSTWSALAYGGIQGPQGIQGIQGIQGDKGDAGDQGLQGLPGDNAYTVAVDNGYTGTEAQWLDSLRAKYGETAIHIPLSPYGVNAYAYTNQPLLGRYFPYDLIVLSVSLTLDTASTGSAFIVDIKQNGVSVFSGLLTVADGQTGSSTYTFANSLTLFSAGDLITFDVTQVGATTPGKYPVLTIEGIRGDVQSVVVPLSPLGTDAVLTVDQALLGRSFPYDFQIDDIILTLDTAPTGSTFIVDVKKNSVSIFNTLLSVDDGENTSTTATTAYALTATPTTITKGDLVTFSIIQIGATTPGKYPVLTIIGREV